MSRHWLSISPSRDTFWYGLASIAGGTAAYLLHAQSGDGTDAVIRTSLISGGTLLGFMTTSLSILVAISNRDFVIRLRQQGKYQNLLNQVFLIIAALALTIGSGFFYIISQHPPLSLLTAFGFAFSLIVVTRIAWKFKQLFRFI